MNKEEKNLLKYLESDASQCEIPDDTIVSQSGEVRESEKRLINQIQIRDAEIDKLRADLQGAKDKLAIIASMLDKAEDDRDAHKADFATCVSALEKIVEDTHSMTLRKPIYNIAKDALAKVRR